MKSNRQLDDKNVQISPFGDNMGNTLDLTMDKSSVGASLNFTSTKALLEKSNDQEAALGQSLNGTLNKTIGNSMDKTMDQTN